MIKKLLLPLLLLIPINANAEVTVSKTGIQYNCSVNIWKEIYNNDFSYWANNMPGNWQNNPFSGMTDNNSDWQKIRLCLQYTIKKMAESASATSLSFAHPNEYMITASMNLNDSTKVYDCLQITETQGCQEKGNLVGTGGRFSVVYHTNPNSGNYGCHSAYITSNTGTNHNKHFELETGEYSHGYTGDCNTTIHNLHYFHIENASGTQLIHDNMGSNYFTSTSHTETGFKQ